MPPKNNGVNELLQKAASTSKPTDNWDADFDCESDTLFRSSVSSSGSTSSLHSSSSFGSKDKNTPVLTSAGTFATTRASHRSTADLLDAFRETDDEDGFEGGQTQKLPKRFENIHLSNERFLKDLEDIDDNSLTLNSRNATPKSAISTPNKVNASALTGGTIRRLGKKKLVADDVEDWTEDFSTPKKRLDDYEDTTATIKAKQYRSGLARNNSLIKGTFFDPPSQSNSPTKSRIQRQPKFEEEDFADGFDGDALGEVDAVLLQKFQTKQQNLPEQLPEEEDLDIIFEEEIGSGATSSSLRESGNSSIFSNSTASNTESEVDGEDFLDGLILPDNANFHALLKRHNEEAKERERQENPGKFDSIGSNESGHLSIPDGTELDFLDGFEIGGGELIKGDTMDTLHRNVKIKGKDGMTKRSGSPSKRKRVGFGNVPDLRTSSSASQGFNRMGSVQPPSTIRMEKLRAKKSMPALRSQRLPLTVENVKLASLASLPASSNDAIELVQRAKKPMAPVPECEPKRVVSSGLRSVQSLSNLKPEPRAKPRSRFSKAHTGKIIGDGTELDSFADLPTNANQEISFTVRPAGKTIKSIQPQTYSRKPLETYREKPAKDTLRKQHRPAFKSTKQRSKNGSKLGLIQQLGPPVSTVVKGYSGNMHFNVKTYTWEGNNEDLKRFDNSSKAPGLIAYISTKGIQIVGDMVFDPAKMKWINLHEDAAADDPFDGVDDLDVTIKGGNGVALRFSHNTNEQGGPHSDKRNYTDTTISTISIMSSPTKRPSVSTQSGLTSTTDDYAVGKEFEISVDMLRRFRNEESRWEHKVQGWFPPDEAFNREYLGEIRTMVMRQG